MKNRLLDHAILIAAVLCTGGCQKAVVDDQLPEEGVYRGSWREQRNGIAGGIYHTDTTIEAAMEVRYRGDSMHVSALPYDTGRVYAKFLKNKEGVYNLYMKPYMYYFAAKGKKEFSLTYTVLNLSGPGPTRKVEFEGVKQ